MPGHSNLVTALDSMVHSSIFDSNQPVQTSVHGNIKNKHLKMA